MRTKNFRFRWNEKYNFVAYLWHRNKMWRKERETLWTFMIWSILESLLPPSQVDVVPFGIPRQCYVTVKCHEKSKSLVAYLSALGRSVHFNAHFFRLLFPFMKKHAEAYTFSLSFYFLWIFPLEWAFYGIPSRVETIKNESQKHALKQSQAFEKKKKFGFDIPFTCWPRNCEKLFKEMESFCFCFDHLLSSRATWWVWISV